jgi:hypothetical protein
MEQKIKRGFSCERLAKSRPYLAKPPTLKFSTLDSAKIDYNRFLAAIAAVKIGRSFRAVMGNKGRTPLARIIALGAFNLDNLGPKVGKCLSGKRARKDPR